MPIFAVFMHNFDTETGQNIISPTNFMSFYTNFEFYKLVSHMGLHNKKHNFHRIIPSLCVFVMMV